MTIGDTLSARIKRTPTKVAAVAIFLLVSLFLLPVAALAQGFQTVVGEQGTSIEVLIESKSSSWFDNLFKTYSVIPPHGLVVGGTFQDNLEFWGAANIKADKIKVIITKSSGATYDVYNLPLSSQQKSDLAVAGRYVLVSYNFKAPYEIGTYTLRANVVDSTGKYLGIYDLSNEFRVRTPEEVVPVKCQPAVCDDVWSFSSNIEGGHIEKQDCRWYETSTCKVIKTTTSKRTICNSGFNLVYGTCVKIQTPPPTPKTCSELGGDNYCIQNGYASCNSNTGNCEGVRQTGTCEEVGGTCRGYIGPISGCTGSKVKVDARCGILQNCCKTPDSTGGSIGGSGSTCASDEVKQADGTCEKVSAGDFTVVKTQPSIPIGRLGTASGGTLLNSLCTADSDCGSGACEDIETLEAELDDKARSIIDRINEAKEAKSNDITSALAHGTAGKIIKWGIGLFINTDAFKEEPKSICVMRREGGFDFGNFFKDNQALVIGVGIIILLLFFLPRFMG